MKEDTYPLETHELVYNVVKDALNTQFQSLDRLNTIQYKSKCYHWICWCDNWNVVKYFTL